MGKGREQSAGGRTYDALSAVGLLVQHEGHLRSAGIIRILYELHDDTWPIHVRICTEHNDTLVSHKTLTSPAPPPPP